MTSKVLQFPGVKQSGSEGGEDISPKAMFERFAKEDNLTIAVVAAINDEGRLIWGTNASTAPEALWLNSILGRIILDESMEPT